MSASTQQTPASQASGSSGSNSGPECVPSSQGPQAVFNNPDDLVALMELLKDAPAAERSAVLNSYMPVLEQLASSRLLVTDEMIAALRAEATAGDALSNRLVRSLTRSYAVAFDPETAVVDPSGQPAEDVEPPEVDPEALIDAWRRRAEKIKEGQGLDQLKKYMDSGSPELQHKKSLAAAIYLTPEQLVKREFFSALQIVRGDSAGKISDDMTYVLGMAAARCDPVARMHDPNLELFTMLYKDWAMTGTGQGKGCGSIKGIKQQIVLCGGSAKSKLGATVRFALCRAFAQEIKDRLAAEAPGSEEHALWTKAQGCLADIAVVANCESKKSLTAAQVLAASTAAKNLGMLMLARLGTPKFESMVGFMAFGGYDYDCSMFIEAVLVAISTHICRSPSQAFPTHVEVQANGVKGECGEMEDRVNLDCPSLAIYISAGFLQIMGLAILKFLLGHHGPGTRKVRLGGHNNAAAYSVYENQASHLRATSGSQWIFDREGAVFDKYGSDLVHPDVYTALPAAALAHINAGQGVGPAVVVDAAALLAQWN